MRRRRVALLTALGVDNFGSGLFLPVALVYVIRVVGLPLAVAGLLSVGGPAGYRIAVAGDAASFAVCALVLALLVRIPRPQHRGAAPARAGRGRLLSDRPYLALIVATGLVALPSDFFLSGISVYALTELHTRPWLPGTLLALVTGLNSVGVTVALRMTRGMNRTTAMALAAGLCAAWCGASLAAVAVPAGWRPAALAAATVLLAGAGLLFASRANALAEAAAPAGSRGRYLAAFQYAFTVPGVIAPAVVALFGVAVWLPWLLVGASAGLAVVALRVVARHLPAYALRPPVARRPPRLQSIGSRLPGN
jgi:hypothetical protein